MTTAIQIHHIGWAVRSIGVHHHHFARQIGLAYKGVEEFPTLKVAFYDAGGCLIELLEATDASDDVATFLERRGEGIHHIAYRVDDVADALRQAAVKGLRLLDREPRHGAHGTRIGFVDLVDWTVCSWSTSRVPRRIFGSSTLHLPTLETSDARTTRHLVHTWTEDRSGANRARHR